MIILLIEIIDFRLKLWQTNAWTTLERTRQACQGNCGHADGRVVAIRQLFIYDFCLFQADVMNFYQSAKVQICMHAPRVNFWEMLARDLFRARSLIEVTMTSNINSNSSVGPDNIPPIPVYTSFHALKFPTNCIGRKIVEHYILDCLSPAIYVSSQNLVHTSPTDDKINLKKRSNFFRKTLTNDRQEPRIK